jgi:hypothetical protein
MPFKGIYRTTNVKKLPEKDLHIRDAGDNDPRYKDAYLVPMHLLVKKVMHDLVVLENVQDKILGIDFIRQHALGHNSLSSKCDSRQLQAQERIFIDALCSQKIKLKFLNNGNQKNWTQ